MDTNKKVRLIYSLEFGIIALAFLVIGILRVVGLMGGNDTFHDIFKWVSMFGGIWIIADFIWASISATRRERICYLDKILNLPAGLFIVGFDIYAFIGFGENAENMWRFGLGGLFIYIGLDYGFQAIYHYFKPVQNILDVANNVVEKGKKK